MIYNLPRKKKAASYPVKGDLIELDLDGQGAKDYRVLKISGSVAQVMALTSATKAAIVPENVVQHCYQYYDEPNTPDTPTYTYQYQYNWSDSDYENANDVGNVTVGNRNVFALDLKDIFDYFDKVCITSDELMTLFWNSTAKVSKYLWLRSSSADSSGYAWSVDGDYGDLNYGDSVYGSGVVRPALNLDISQIPYTKK